MMFVGDGDCYSGNGGCDPSTGSGSPSLLDRMLVGPWSERRGTMRKTKYFILEVVVAAANE